MRFHSNGAKLKIGRILEKAVSFICLITPGLHPVIGSAAARGQTGRNLSSWSKEQTRVDVLPMISQFFTIKSNAMKCSIELLVFFILCNLKAIAT